MNLRQSWGTALFFAAVFLFFLVFFTEVHPLVLFNGDDWSGVSLFRVPLPNPSAWNPVKLLPECSMSLVALFSAFAVTPVIGDYFRAMTWTMAILFSAIFTVYVYLFFRILCGKEENCGRAFIFTFLFLLFHFLILKRAGMGNPHLFYSGNIECYFHYLLPAYLNAMLVLLVMRAGTLTSLYQRLSPLQAGALFLGIYLAVCSNVLHNILLLSYLGVTTMQDVWQARKEKTFVWKSFLQAHRAEACVLVFWLLILLCEAMGGRAHSIGKPLADSSFSAIGASLYGFAHMFNAGCVILCLLLAAAALFVAHRKDAIDTEEREAAGLITRSLLAMALMVLYLLIVCQRAGMFYFTRTDVAVGWLFYFLVAAVLAMHLLILRYPALLRALPILALIMLVSTANQSKDFQNLEDLPAEACYAVDRDILSQVQAADRAGQEEMILRVPKGDNRDNWRHPLYMGRAVSNTLYRHGQIAHPIKITIQPDPAMNEQYHIPIPKN